VARLSASLLPPLGRRAWRLLAGILVFEIGTGMTLPLLIVFLHDQRGISLGSAGLALAAVGAGGLVATLAAGLTTDRLGAGWTAVGGLALAGAATASYLAVHSAPAAIAVSAAQGAGFAANWVGVFPLLVDAVPTERRGDVLGTSYGVTNLGLGIGSTLAGLVLAADASAFAPLFAVDALSYALFAAALIAVGEVRHRERRPADHGGYMPVLRDRRLLAATGLMIVLVVAGYSQFTSAFPIWATSVVGAPSSLVGFAFAANTWTIAVAQLPALSLMRGHRRTRALAVTGVVFATSWLVALAADHASRLVVAEAALILAAAVFGLGETMLSPSLPAIVQDIAGDENRGRYVAVFSMSWQIGPMIGPAIAGAALAAGHGAGLLAALAITCALVAPAAVAFERLLPAAANGVPRQPAGAYPAKVENVQ
jgi:MFS family permease